MCLEIRAVHSLAAPWLRGEKDNTRYDSNIGGAVATERYHTPISTVCDILSKGTVKCLFDTNKVQVALCVTFARKPITNSNSPSEITTGCGTPDSLPSTFVLHAGILGWTWRQHPVHWSLRSELPHCHAHPCIRWAYKRTGVGWL